jgi:hypothetical protein
MTRKSVHSKVQWDHIATYVGTVIAVIGFCFSLPSIREIFAYPTLWSQTGDVHTTNTANAVTIHKSDTEILEKGELSFLFLEVPYTADFHCQLHPKDGSWKGTCLYNFKIAGTRANFSCSVTTTERITSFTRKSIVGYSQPLDAPDKPNHCPTPTPKKGSEDEEATERFVLQPAPDKS